MQRRFRGRAPRVGIEVCVAQKLEQRTVNLIGAGLREDVDDTAREASELGVIVVGHDAELFHGIGIRRDVAGVAEACHVRSAIEKIVH